MTSFLSLNAIVVLLVSVPWHHSTLHTQHSFVCDKRKHENENQANQIFKMSRPTFSATFRRQFFLFFFFSANAISRQIRTFCYSSPLINFNIYKFMFELKKQEKKNLQRRRRRLHERTHSRVCFCSRAVIAFFCNCFSRPFCRLTCRFPSFFQGLSFILNRSKWVEISTQMHS